MAIRQIPVSVRTHRHRARPGDPITVHNSFPATTVPPNVCCGQRDPLLAGAVAMRAARQEWPDSRLDVLIERTVTDIKRTVGSRRAGFAWTGAVDSLVLAHLAELAGIGRCVLAITDLEYPGFLRWVTDCMPDGLTMVFHRGQELRWLSTKPLMLFPP